MKPSATLAEKWEIKEFSIWKRDKKEVTISLKIRYLKTLMLCSFVAGYRIGSFYFYLLKTHFWNSFVA